MKVRSLRPHRNAFGDAFAKKVGDEYEHPAPEGDIACGIVATADETPAAPEEASDVAAAGDEKAPKKRVRKKG